MSEELKYKVGDKVLVEAEVIRADNSHGNPYQILFDDGRTFALNRGMLEDNAIQLPPKPKVTHAVMDWYEEVESEKADWTIRQWLGSLDMSIEVKGWLYGENHLENQHALATLIAYGPEAVEVEKEKKYTVELKNANQILVYNYKDENYYFKLKTAPIYTNDEKSTFTKQELIEAGFGGVFDNEMFEVEEVVND